MKKRNKIRIAALMLSASMCLCGCVKTVDQLYQLPRRSEGYHNLQAVMDRQMSGLEYCAPTSGENQQAVQIADLDQDGTEEILLFAKGNDDCPLKIIIFRREDDNYTVSARLEQTGTAFNQVEYVQMDGKGLQIVVGTELSNEVLRKVAVYRYEDGHTEQLLSTNYYKFFASDLDRDGSENLLVVHAGEEENDPGMLQMYSIEDGVLIRSGSARLSEPVHSMRRIMNGNLSGGRNAFFIASMAGSSSIVTDVFTCLDGELVNLSLGGEESLHTLRNYYIYGEDIDGDGEVELPKLMQQDRPEGMRPMGSREHLICWYAVSEERKEIPKRYTYHNYQQGWYLELEGGSADRIFAVAETPDTYVFYVEDADGDAVTKLWSITKSTPDRGREPAEIQNQFLLVQTDHEIYTAGLEPEAIRRGATEEMLCKAFHLIQRGWKTGEM